MNAHQTGRLIVQPATTALARADLADQQGFARLLAADIPASWPPAFYDDVARRWVLAASSDDASKVFSYYLLIQQEPAKPVLIGTGGFKGPPQSGETEIGYSLVPEWQRKGLGTEFVHVLTRHAFEVLGVSLVCAHTLPGLTASRRVLEKNGFVQRGIPSEADALRYEITRAEWQRQENPTRHPDS